MLNLQIHDSKSFYSSFSYMITLNSLNIIIGKYNVLKAIA